MFFCIAPPLVLLPSPSVWEVGRSRCQCAVVFWQPRLRAAELRVNFKVDFTSHKWRNAPHYAFVSVIFSVVCVSLVVNLWRYFG